MSRICPQCTQVNQESVAFCTRCGYRFQGNEQIVNDDAVERPAALPLNQSTDIDPSATFVAGVPNRASQSEASVAQLPFQQQPSVPAYTVPTAPPNTPYIPATPPNLAAQNANQFQGGYMPPQQQQGSYQPVYGQPPYGAPPMAVSGSGNGLSGLQRAFAGKGTPVHHQSWLLGGKLAQPMTIRDSLVENIHKQGVLGISATPEHLREQGVIMEERDYIRVRYGSSSVFVYVAPIGQDLYISRISTVQQPLSRIRMIVLGGMLALMAICFIIYVAINPNFNDASLNAKTFFSYPAFGLLFFFIFLLLRSLVFFLTDNDFLAYLRPNRLNDFTLDALSLVEQVTDKSIRETVKQAGLKPDEITQPTQSYALEQPLHRF